MSIHFLLLFIWQVLRGILHREVGREGGRGRGGRGRGGRGKGREGKGREGGGVEERDTIKHADQPRGQANLQGLFH